jgi:hypothetical protein
MRILAQFVIKEGAKTTATILICIKSRPKGYVVRASCEIVIDKVTGGGNAGLCLFVAV